MAPFDLLREIARMLFHEQQIKESEGSMKRRNAEPRPLLQNSWEQQALGSPAQEKGFPARTVQFVQLSQWLRDILICCCLPPLQQNKSRLCSLKYGLIVPKIDFLIKQRRRADSNKWISFEAES